jgi:pimeloyl-ACP methyl ester carboxylesterase
MDRQKIFFRFVTGILVVAGSAFAYEAYAEHRDSVRFAPRVAMISVDGHRMHIKCTGQGEPSVILEGPLTGLSATWRPVQEGIARFTRVCSYDRAGYGWSEPGPLPRSSERIARELHALLAQAGVRPPYVMVGASAGGYHVRVFAGDFPGDVAGMVLVDSSHPDQVSRLHLSENPTAQYEDWEPFLPIAQRLGILRLGLRFEHRAAAFPADAWDEVLFLRAKAESYRTLLREGEAWKESADHVRASGNLGSKPLIVLSGARGADPAWRSVWVDGLQADLVRLSSRGRQVVLSDSGHGIQFEAPMAVVDAVREVWDPVRATN